MTTVSGLLPRWSRSNPNRQWLILQICDFNHRKEEEKLLHANLIWYCVYWARTGGGKECLKELACEKWFRQITKIFLQQWRYIMNAVLGRQMNAYTAVKFMSQLTQTQQHRYVSYAATSQDFTSLCGLHTAKSTAANVFATGDFAFVLCNWNDETKQTKITRVFRWHILYSYM